MRVDVDFHGMNRGSSTQGRADFCDFDQQSPKTILAFPPIRSFVL